MWPAFSGMIYLIPSCREGMTDEMSCLQLQLGAFPASGLLRDAESWMGLDLVCKGEIDLRKGAMGSPCFTPNPPLFVLSLMLAWFPFHSLAWTSKRAFCDASGSRNRNENHPYPPFCLQKSPQFILWQHHQVGLGKTLYCLKLQREALQVRAWKTQQLPWFLLAPPLSLREDPIKGVRGSLAWWMRSWLHNSVKKRELHICFWSHSLGRSPCQGGVCSLVLTLDWLQVWGGPWQSAIHGLCSPRMTQKGVSATPCKGSGHRVVWEISSRPFCKSWVVRDASSLKSHIMGCLHNLTYSRGRHPWQP